MSIWLVTWCLLTAQVTSPDDVALVSEGRPLAVRSTGPGEWVTREGRLVGSGVGNVLWAEPLLGEGDWSLRARLVITDLAESAASLVIDGSHFGFEGRTGEMFVEGPLFGGPAEPIGRPVVHEGEPFTLVVRQNGSTLTFSIDGEEVHRLERRARLAGELGLRPHRATMHIESWILTGQTSPRPEVERPPFETLVFESGTEGYHTFRIPAVIAAPSGDLLAFAEGRQKSRSDTGDIDLVLRRSSDDGDTWSDLQIVWDDEANTCGNPCPVVDESTGTIWLLMTWNLGSDHERAIKAAESADTRRVFVSRSEDDGRTWSTAQDITSDTKSESWRWYATGPGVGIQLRRGEQAGRLVIPCDHSSPEIDVPGGYGSHVIFSDDHGETWRLGEPIPAGVNECQVAELEDGRLLLNMRNYDRSRTCRAIATSSDGGITWSDVSYDSTLIESICQASLIRSRWRTEERAGVLLFANPASTSGRRRMTVRLSQDDGASWPIAKTIYSGPAAYSCLVALSEDRIGLLYEKDDYRSIAFARFGEDWLRE